jgi:FdhE protein
LEVNSSILKRLDEWNQKEGSLPEILEFYRDLVRVQVGASAPAPDLRFAKADIDAEIRKGIPLLRWDALSVDWASFEKVFRDTAAVVREHYESAAHGLEEVSADRSFLQDTARAWYEGSSLTAAAKARGIDEEPLAVALHSAAKPFLAPQAKALMEMVPQGQWRRGICPVCGGKPDFAFLDKEKGARWLLCSRCDTEWLFQRLECPYCGNKDQEKLKYYADEDALYRLYICLRCKTYLKAIDLRKTEADILLPLERVLTADMDRQGREEGYTAGWVTAPQTGEQ